MRVISTAVAVISLASAKSPYPPFPAQLTMSRGVTFPIKVAALPWGTPIATTQNLWVTLKARAPGVEWGVWDKSGGSSQFPVRSTDGGIHWRAAGPLLSTHWSGGDRFRVVGVFTHGAASVVMVSAASVDVSTDGGHQWYEARVPNDIWSMTSVTFAAGTYGLRVEPLWAAPFSSSPFAVYLLDSTHHQWIRVQQSLKNRGSTLGGPG